MVVRFAEYAEVSRLGCSYQGLGGGHTQEMCPPPALMHGTWHSSTQGAPFSSRTVIVAATDMMALLGAVSRIAGSCLANPTGVGWLCSLGAATSAE
jgi:hypothetical protein